MTAKPIKAVSSPFQQSSRPKRSDEASKTFESVSPAADHAEGKEHIYSVVFDGNMRDASSTESRSASSSPARRLIFCSYWKDDNGDTAVVPPQHSQTKPRSNSPKCVRRHPSFELSAKSKHFGKHEQNVKLSSNEQGKRDSDPTSHKERMTETMSDPKSRQSLSSMWKSLPALFMEELPTPPRASMSDPSLSSKRRELTVKSTLRKGRFSRKGSSSPRSTPRKKISVSFQPIISVHPFEPPIDHWAESGWSKQFDS